MSQLGPSFIAAQIAVILFLIILNHRLHRATRDGRLRNARNGWALNFLYVTAAWFTEAGIPIPEAVRALIPLLSMLSSSQFAISGIWRAQKPGTLPEPPSLSIVILVHMLFAGPAIAFALLPSVHTRYLGIGLVLLSLGAITLLCSAYRAVASEVQSGHRTVTLLVVAGALYGLVQPLFLIQSRHTVTCAFFAGLISKALIASVVLDFLVTLASRSATEIQRARSSDQIVRTVGRLVHELGTPLRQANNRFAAIRRHPASRALPGNDLISLENALLRTTAVLDGAGFLLPGRDEMLALQDLGSGAMGRTRFTEPRTISVNTAVQMAVMAVKDTRVEPMKFRLEFSAGCTVHCRPVALFQILTNLLRNTYDAAPAEHAFASIRTSRRRNPPGESGDLVCIELSDNGHGIPEALRESVFREGVSTRPGPGRGFGLTVVRDLLAECGGTIAFESRDAATGDATGTRWTITLPHRKEVHTSGARQ